LSFAGLKFTALAQFKAIYAQSKDAVDRFSRNVVFNCFLNSAEEVQA
jgi:hypothetical protein